MPQKTTDYKRKFNEEKYDRLYITVEKGKKDEIENISKQQGKSLNSFVNEAITEKINKEAKGE